jgi:hypothetical protein
LQIKSALLHISEESILKSLGVPADKADDYLMGQIRKLTNQCIDISSPCASWSVFSNPQFINDTGTMKLGGKIFHLNKMVTSALGKSTEVAIFIGTCGKKVELYSKQLMKDGNSLEGYIVDLIGSDIAEGVADFIHKKIESNMANSGLTVTNRYSPGYCNWPVSDQQQLFQLLKENDCGIQLTPSSLMLPIKSVSGIIGAGKHVENTGYTCAICDVSQCLYRNKK